MGCEPLPGCGVLVGNEEQVQQNPWSYVGEKKGGYEKVETLVWVGEGNGSFDRNAILPQRGNPGGYGNYLYSTAAPPVIYPSQPAPPAANPAPPVAPHPHPPVFNQPAAPVHGSAICESQPNMLSAPQKMWCCANKGIACPRLDCDLGFKIWEKGWSTGKQLWCCKHAGRGCHDQMSSPHPQQPMPPFPVPNNGAPPAVAAAAAQVQAQGAHVYDCMAGFAKWWQNWNDD